MPDFKDNLVSLRKQHGLSQFDLAKELSRVSRKAYTRSAVSLWEGGQRTPSRETLEVIADYFQCDLNWLLGRDEKNAPDYPEITLIARAGKKMTAEQRDLLLRWAKITFPDAFENN